MKEDFLNLWWYPVRFWFLHVIGGTKFKACMDAPRDEEMTFNEEFDKHELDREKWNTSFPWGRNDGNFEGNCWATDGDNIEIVDSVARFWIKLEPNTVKMWGRDYNYDYTTAHIDTNGKFEQSMGKWDVKLRFPDKYGHWPAVWLLTRKWEHPEAIGNNNGKHEVILPEIDVFEQFGGKKNMIQFSLHTGLSYKRPWLRSFTNKIHHVNLTKQWWVLSMEISEKTLVWKLNGITVKKLYQRGLYSHERVHRPMYIIISNGTTGTGPQQDVSLDMQVDWVRAYENKE